MLSNTSSVAISKLSLSAMKLSESSISSGDFAGTTGSDSSIGTTESILAFFEALELKFS